MDNQAHARQALIEACLIAHNTLNEPVQPEKFKEYSYNDLHHHLELLQNRIDRNIERLRAKK